MNPRPINYLSQISSDADLVEAALLTGPLDAPIEACPDWDLRALTSHLGFVHRWATLAISSGGEPNIELIEGADSTASKQALATWFAQGALALVKALSDADLDQPTWHPFPAERIVSVWARRMAHETAVHRWDAQRAVGTTDQIDPALASDGIDEYFTLGVERVLQRDSAESPVGSLHVHCTDVEGEWLVWIDSDGYHVVREHQKGDAAFRGPAESILLALRDRDASSAELSKIGDETVLNAWLDEVPGW